MIAGRFDDLRAGTALAFPTPTRVLTARTHDEVAGVLAAVQAAAAAGSWAYGFLAYEAGAGLDPTLPRSDPPDGVPLARFGIGDAPADVAPVSPADAARPHAAGPWTPTRPAAAHRRGVAAVREHIAAGLTYQCNLTGRLRAPVSGDLTALYARLALGQRGAHNAYLDLGDVVVASASPELFFELRDDRLLLRPMKGTAPRGRTSAEDARLAAALRADPKERAENVMIVDLMRNDAGRVARTGSVAVEALCRVERYETVLQLTSDVSARLRPDVGLVDVFRALFPCGSVTGVPKPRTMELITELEEGPRGVYCGAIGWVAPPGHDVRARFSVAIRTVVADPVRGVAEYGVGGGITWGSDPDAEYAELLAKARVLDRPAAGFGLLETFALVDGRMPRLDGHLARLADSADFLGFACDPVAVRTAVGEAVAGRDTARVRLELRRDGTVTVTLAPLPSPTPGPVVLALDEEPVDATTFWPHHKTTRREPYDRRRARHPEADDVVLVNHRGEVTETAVASLAALLDGVWCTPPLGGGALPGVERARLVGDGTLTERTLRPEDLRRAGALAVVSSLRGWRPATLLPAERPVVAASPA